MMSSGIYATWYELEEESKSEFLDWMHNSYIPQELTRPGYLWAAHYELGYVGEAVQKVVDTLIYDKSSALGSGRGFLILFGGLSAYTFFDPNPNQKEEQQDEKTENVTEELILYLFLGVFVIFVVDSFARAGKYTR